MKEETKEKIIEIISKLSYKEMLDELESFPRELNEIEKFFLYHLKFSISSCEHLMDEEEIEMIKLKREVQKLETEKRRFHNHVWRSLRGLLSGRY